MVVEPGKETDDGGAVTEMRSARAVDLCLVLDRLRQNARIVSGYDLGASGFEHVLEAHRRRLRVEADARLSLPKGLEPAVERMGRKQLCGFLQMAAHIVAGLGGIDEQSGPAPRGDEGKGKRERRMVDIGAADVEQPGDR